MNHQPIRPERVRAFGAGVLAAAAMTTASAVARSTVMSELQQLAGTLVAPPRSAASRAIGLTTQLVNGGLFAQLYLAAFENAGLRAGWRDGLTLGLLHGAAAGLFLGVVPALHHRVPEQLPAPGPFMLNRGAHAAVTLVALHGLFGAIVGATLAVGVDPASHSTQGRLGR